MRLTYGKEIKPKKEDEKKKEKSTFAKSTGQFVLELLKIVIISLVIIIPIRIFLIQPFYVKGASMEPTFYDNEYLIIDEITYRFSEPQRGDIVVVKYPQDTSQFFIKRIVGLPGETMEIKNGAIYINGNFSEPIKIEEEYLDEGVITSGEKQVTLDNNEYYILGDNRQSSLDSRSFGPIKRDYIIGKAWLRVWPFNKFHHFEPPEYNLSP